MPMRKFAVFLITVFSVLTMFNLQVMTFAKDDEISVAGREYELDEKSRYDYTRRAEKQNPLIQSERGQRGIDIYILWTVSCSR